MTAKEIHQQLIDSINALDSIGINTAYYRKLLANLMDQYAKEQREKCALNVDREAIYCGEEAIINRIMNAPKPEL